MPMHACRATRVRFASANTSFHAARRCAPLAARVVKGCVRERRGNPSAGRCPAPGLREKQSLNALAPAFPGGLAPRLGCIALRRGDALDRSANHVSRWVRHVLRGDAAGAICRNTVAVSAGLTALTVVAWCTSSPTYFLYLHESRALLVPRWVQWYQAAFSQHASASERMQSVWRCHASQAEQA
jgi:hypothetical protein